MAYQPVGFSHRPPDRRPVWSEPLFLNDAHKVSLSFVVCLARAKKQPHDDAGNYADAEANRQRFAGSLPHQLLDFGVPLTRRFGSLPGRFLNGFGRLLGICEA